MTRLAVLTGASRGLGLAMAGQLRAQGWRVRGLARHTAHADDLVADLADPAAIAPAFRAALAGEDPTQLEALLVVHNAATVTPLGHTAGQPATTLAAAVHLNLTAGMLLFAAAIEHCQALPAHKVLAQITSSAAERAHPGLSVYCATKAGMEQHVRVLALEQATQAHPFIAVNLDPGAMDTAMQGDLRDADPAGGLAVQDFVARRREGRLAEAEAVARDLVAHLTQPGLISGQRYRALSAVRAASAAIR